MQKPRVFKTRVLLKIFDAEFPYKLSYFEPLCLLAKMAAKTVKRRIALKLRYQTHPGHVPYTLRCTISDLGVRLNLKSPSKLSSLSQRFWIWQPTNGSWGSVYKVTSFSKFSQLSQSLNNSLTGSFTHSVWKAPLPSAVRCPGIAVSANQQKIRTIRFHTKRICSKFCYGN